MDSFYQAAAERAAVRAREAGAPDLPGFVPPKSLEDGWYGKAVTAVRKVLNPVRSRAAWTLLGAKHYLETVRMEREEGPDPGTGRVIQLLTSYSSGDGVGNDVTAIDRLLRKEGIPTVIYAWIIDPKLARAGIRAVEYSRKRFLEDVKENDLILYHHSIYTPLANVLRGLKCRVVIVYHNITPPEYFLPYSRSSVENCRKGLEQTKQLRNVPDRCIAVSEYNRQDLLGMGYRCPIDVIPILIPFADYDKPANRQVTDRMRKDGFTNVLFVGRIAPNKCQEDVIAAFSCYQRYYNSRSRLIILGSGLDSAYGKRVAGYAEKLGVQNLVFAGHIPFDDILGYYRSADLFLCMSGHEGFCIPLVEAMHFGIPVIAYDSSAVGETLKDGGILIKDKDPMVTAALIDEVLSSAELKERMRIGRKERLEHFGEEAVGRQFLAWIREQTGR